MKISARNQLKGEVVELERGAVHSIVVVEVAPGQRITSSITNLSADELGLEVGSEAYAIVKSSDVILAVEHTNKGN